MTRVPSDAVNYANELIREAKRVGKTKADPPFEKLNQIIKKKKSQTAFC